MGWNHFSYGSHIRKNWIPSSSKACGTYAGFWAAQPVQRTLREIQSIANDFDKYLVPLLTPAQTQLHQHLIEERSEEIRRLTKVRQLRLSCLAQADLFLSLDVHHSFPPSAGSDLLSEFH